MIVQDVMSSTVCLIDLSDPIWEAARVMAENDVGALPVADVMSKEIVYCFDDDDVDRVARRMGDHKIRRLPVVNRDKRLVGIVSLGDLALTDRLSVAGSTVAQVSEPGGAHSQAAH